MWKLVPLTSDQDQGWPNPEMAWYMMMQCTGLVLLPKVIPLPYFLEPVLRHRGGGGGGHEGGAFALGFGLGMQLPLINGLKGFFTASCPLFLQPIYLIRTNK